jgi:hypothetical protein
VTEDPAAVTAMVAAILDSPAAELPPPVAEVDAYRAAARRIVEAEVPVPEKVRLLLALRESLRGAALPDWAQRVVWEEIRGPICGRPAPGPFLPPQPVEWASRTLRRLGYETCPVCHRHVTPEVTLETYRRRRAWAAEDAATHRAAVRHPAVRQERSG